MINISSNIINKFISSFYYYPARRVLFLIPFVNIRNTLTVLMN